MTRTSSHPTKGGIADLISRAADIGPDASRLAVRLTRLLAKGNPVSGEQVAGLIDDLGINPAKAAEHLTMYAERNDQGEIIGVVPGITLRPTTHSLVTDAAQVWGWCALDTLVLPAVLGQEAQVESTQPNSQETTRFTVSPNGVRDVQPAGAVVSVPGLAPGERVSDSRHLVIDLADVISTEQVWRAFCYDAHAFTSPEVAREHFTDREDVVLLSLPDGFDVMRVVADRLLAHE